ncbi:hypothetical protein H7170_03620 [Candidatus Gracilibacteria bacterium]|nr:hypothetical protein [Candidatus Gracilibacteria bacterium]
MPLSFNDAFIYDDSTPFPGFEQQPIYQSDLRVGKFSDLGTSQYWHLEKLLNNIKLYFPNGPDRHEWIDEILLEISDEGYGFNFMGLKDILNTYKKINQSILYASIEKTARELCPDDFDRLRIIFYGDFDSFSFLGYYPGAKGSDILSKSLSLLTKPNPSDECKIVVDGVKEDIICIGDEVRFHRGIQAINEKGVYIDNSTSIASSLITGRVHLLVPICNREDKSSQGQFSKNYKLTRNDDLDEIPF